MENANPKKSSMLKLVGAFVAGVLITAIVMLATTGSFFTGALRVPTKSVDSRFSGMSAEDVKTTAQMTIEQRVAKLESELRNTKSHLNSWGEFINKWHFSGNLPGRTTQSLNVPPLPLN